MLSFFPRDVLDETLNLIESVSEGFPSYLLFSTKFREIILNDIKVINTISMPENKKGNNSAKM